MKTGQRTLGRLQDVVFLVCACKLKVLYVHKLEGAFHSSLGLRQHTRTLAHTPTFSIVTICAPLTGRSLVIALISDNNLQNVLVAGITSFAVIYMHTPNMQPFSQTVTFFNFKEHKEAHLTVPSIMSCSGCFTVMSLEWGLFSKTVSLIYATRGSKA